MPHHRPSAGFTLIELSIVLVIIGLIVGGILVGRDMIRAAELRKTISTMEKFQSAINTFKTKYNCLPGDCANASQFFPVENGNGDGKINAAFNAAPATYWYAFVVGSVDQEGKKEEVTLVSEHLAFANLIPLAPFDRTGTIPQSMAGNWYIDMGRGIPLLALTDPFGNNIFRLGGGQYIAGGSTINTASNGISSTAINVLEPEDAMQIDVKLDDGLPRTGQIVAENWIGFVQSGLLTDQFGCYASASGVQINQYNIQHTIPAGGSTYYYAPCKLSLRNRF